jgi:hypothetical protein
MTVQFSPEDADLAALEWGAATQRKPCKDGTMRVVNYAVRRLNGKPVFAHRLVAQRMAPAGSVVRTVRFKNHTGQGGRLVPDTGDCRRENLHVWY